MQRHDINEAASLVLKGVDLPDYVFAKRFRSHFFFDSNLGYAELTQAIRQLAAPCVGPDTRVAVFSSYTRTFLGWIEGSADWAPAIEDMAQRLEDEGDYGGMFWADAAGRMAVYQWQPVDLGIVALDVDVPDRVVPSKSDDAYFDTDYFFGTRALQLMLEDTSKAGLSHSETIGREFAQALVRNYSYDGDG